MTESPDDRRPASPVPTPAATAGAPPAAGDDSGRLLRWVFAAVALVFFVATARGYGYFRDELYYLVNGEHLGWGYVDHPPLIGLVAAITRALVGDSLYAIRLPPALAAAATVWLTGRMTGDLGGGRFAQALAMTATLVAPVYLSLFSILSMNAFDVLLWTVGWWVLVRLFASGDDRWWLAFGAVAGLGLQNKLSFLFLGLGVAAGVLITGRWALLKSRRLWLGAAIAALVFLPHVVWQATHGWPTLEFMDNARRLKNLELAPADFVAEQALQMGPAALPLWLAGLGWLMTSLGDRRFRPLGWAYPAILGAMLLAGGAKAYYLAPAYTLLFAAGGVAVAAWTAGPARTALRAAALVLVAVGGAIVAPLAKPLLPVDTFVRYSAALGIAPSSGERQELGRLPQFYADMHGWPELAQAVAEVYRSLPPADRDRACFFGQNYGEAAAVGVLGRPLGLPPAISAHNSYWLWGPGDCTGEVMIVLGDDRERLEELFASVEPGGVFRCTDCMPYENGLTLWIARDVRMPIDQLWPEIKSFI